MQVGEQEDGSKQKPPRASLFKTMEPETVTLEDALALLSLPRVVGVDPSDGEEITAQNGRYGAYLKKGSDSRSLASEDQLLTIGLDEALALYAQPKRGRGAVAKPPLRELGPDPVSGRPIVVKEGRFGPYVTDGETNATLSTRAGDTPENVTPERAASLLQTRREAGPPAKRSSRGGAKKAAAPGRAAASKAGRPARSAGATKAVRGTKKAGATKVTRARKAT